MTAVRAAIPAGIGLHFARYPVVFASLKPPANGFNPSGMDSSVQLQTYALDYKTTLHFSALLDHEVSIPF